MSCCAALCLRYEDLVPPLPLQGAAAVGGVGRGSAHAKGAGRGDPTGSPRVPAHGARTLLPFASPHSGRCAFLTSRCTQCSCSRSKTHTRQGTSLRSWDPRGTRLYSIKVLPPQAEKPRAPVECLNLAVHAQPPHTAHVQLADVSRLTHFMHAPNLAETVWRNLPAIAEGMGIKV